MLDHYIPAGICIKNDKLAEWFDDTGNVRKDIDFIEILDKLSWEWYNDNGWQENEEIVYNKLFESFKRNLFQLH